MGILASDQITITDVTDGYAVILTSETYTFVEDSSGGTKNQSCTTEAVAYCGSNQCSAVNVSEKDIVCPTGITAEVSNSGSSKVKIAFKTSVNLTGACEATIPVVVDGIIVNKKFSLQWLRQELMELRENLVLMDKMALMVSLCLLLHHMVLYLKQIPETQC